MNAFADYTYRDASDGRKLSYRLASIFVWTVPFATAQERTDELPPAVVAMDAIAAMESHCKLAIPPAFVNVVGNCPRHTRGTCQTNVHVRRRTSTLGAGKEGVALHIFLNGQSADTVWRL